MYSATQNSQSVSSPREEIHAADAGHGNNLDLSLGMSVHGPEDKSCGANLQVFAAPMEKSVLCAGGSSGGTAGAGGAVLHRRHVVGSCFGSERSWFVHPCLEERQLKAASGPPPPPQSEVMREAQPTAPVVGWPPVRASRKNLSGPRLSTKPSMEADEKEAKKPKTSEDHVEACNNKPEKSKVIMAAASTMTMFVKVNMEGLAVGRKIDLMAHDGYGSLSTTLRKLFDSFLSGKKKSIDGECGDENGDAKISGSLELLYEDNEGDKLLVGDVPWEMFVGSVKRLYITYCRKTHHLCATRGRDKDINVK